MDASTRLAGVIGWPLGHTLSPAMHNAVYADLGLNWVYLALPIEHEADVAGVLSAVRVLPFVGLNVTMPYKRTAMALCDEVTELVSIARAVNTIVCSEGRLIGFNTDGLGLIEALERDARFVPAERDIVVLGAGGAASGAVAALAQASARSVSVVNRDPARAAALVERVSAHFPAVKMTAAPLGEAAAASVSGADLVVNATSVGMNDGDPSPIPAAWLHRGQVVADMVYRATPTALVSAAREAGAVACDGLGMLVSQGAIAVDIWAGQDGAIASREVMRAAAQTEMRRRAKTG